MVKSNMDTILVTGSSGYVGSTLVRGLSRDFKVVGVDATANELTTHVVIDLRNKNAYKEIENYKFSYLVHAAWDQLTGNLYSNNLQLSENLLNFFSKQKLNGMVFLSSIFASTPTDIQYTKSKLAVESLVTEHDVPYAILRPDMIYSSEEPKLLEQLSYMKKRFSICIGNGKSLRSPTHLSDICIIIRRMFHENRLLNRVYEIGSPVPCTQFQFIQTLAKAYSFDPYVIHIPNRVAEIIFRLTGKIDPEQARTMQHDRVADLTALMDDFSFSPRQFDENSVTLPALSNIFAK